MKTLKYFAVAAIAIIFASCGSKEEKFEVTVYDTNVGGALSEYFSLEDKTYIYEDINYPYSGKIIVELKCIKPLPENLAAHFCLDIFDKDGVLICSDNDVDYDNHQELNQASPGQVVSVTVLGGRREGIPAKIRLSSIVEEVNEDETYSSNDTDEIEESNDNEPTYTEEELAEMIDEYEALVNKFIENQKAGMDIITNSNSYEKAEKIYEKIRNSGNELSSEQDGMLDDLHSTLGNAYLFGAH